MINRGQTIHQVETVKKVLLSLKKEIIGLEDQDKLVGKNQKTFLSIFQEMCAYENMLVSILEDLNNRIGITQSDLEKVKICRGFLSRVKHLIKSV